MSRYLKWLLPRNWDLARKIPTWFVIYFGLMFLFDGAMVILNFPQPWSSINAALLLGFMVGMYWFNRKSRTWWVANVLIILLSCVSIGISALLS